MIQADILKISEAIKQSKLKDLNVSGDEKSHVSIADVEEIVREMSRKYKKLHEKYVESIQQLDTCQHAYSSRISDLKHLAQEFVQYLSKSVAREKKHEYSETESVERRLASKAERKHKRYQYIRTCVYALVCIAAVFTIIKALINRFSR